jgi:hypothetical protein
MSNQKKVLGSKSVVCARVGGANTTSFSVAHFVKRNTKNCGGEKRSGESEDGQKFLPPNPLPFCPPERKSFCSCRAKRGNQNSLSGFSSKKVRISSNKHHHIELVASLGASPLASAANRLWWTRGESNPFLLHAMELYYRCTTGPKIINN